MTELTCPKCGNKFEIEDSESTKKKLAKVQKAHDRQLEVQEEKYQKDKDRDVKKGIKEMLETVNTKAERERQVALDAQQKDFQKGEDSRVEAEVKKKSAATEKELKKNYEQEAQKNKRNYEQEAQQKIMEERRENKEEEAKKSSLYKLEKKRLRNKIKDLERTIDDTQNPEMKGESAEDLLKEKLKDRFPEDEIVDIPKGARGADLMQKVYFKKREIGMILIECKSTVKFYQSWIKKLRKDCERSGSNIGVLVTHTMPKEYEDRLYIEKPPDIFVVQTMVAEDIIDSLRSHMIVDYYNKLSGQAAKDKEGETYLLQHLVTDGKEDFLELSKEILQEQQQIDSDEKGYNKNIKKRRKNLNSLIEIFRKLINGLGNASQHGFELDEVSPILITVDD